MDQAGQVLGTGDILLRARLGHVDGQGRRDTLQQIHDTEEGRMLTFEGGLLLEDFSADVWYTGDSADDFMTRYAKALQVTG